MGCVGLGMPFWLFVGGLASLAQDGRTAMALAMEVTGNRLYVLDWTFIGC